MKTIGLIGGMSWESSLEYYRIINERVKDHLGGLHSAKSLMLSVDFDEIEKLQSKGDWNQGTQVMIDAARRLEQGGAELLVICTNTMHKMADEVAGSISIPLIHIADATAERIQAGRLKRVGLLGTRFTMEEDFYRGRITKRYGLDVLIPEKPERSIVDSVIYHELVVGKILPSSKKQFVEIIGRLADRGAEGVILGCTEIPLLVQQEDAQIPLFDSTRIHAEAAVDYALRTS